MHTPSFTRLLTLSVTLALATTAAQAASITWGAGAQGITGDSNVSTADTFVGALHFGNLAADTTVNGVTFTGISANLINTITSGNFTLTTTNPASLFSATPPSPAGAPFSNLSASYQSLLASTLRIVNTPRRR